MNYNLAAISVAVLGIIAFYVMFIMIPALLLASVVIAGFFEAVAILLFCWATLDEKIKDLDKRLRKLENQ